jgi:hypothetical protein
LHLSPKTIQAYHGRIKDKLQLSDANELIREAIRWVESAGKRNRRTIRQLRAATTHNGHTRFHHR